MSAPDDPGGGETGFPDDTDNPLAVLAEAGRARPLKPDRSAKSPKTKTPRAAKKAAKSGAPAKPLSSGATRRRTEAGPPTQPVAVTTTITPGETRPRPEPAAASAEPAAAPAPRRARRQPKPTPAAAQGTGASVQGLLIIGVAVFIGAVLLLKGYSQDQSLTGGAAVVASSTTSTLVPNSPTSANLPTTTVPTSTSLRPPSSVTVRVGKAGAAEGVATADANKLTGSNYKASAFDSSQTLPASKVYYQPGFQAEAAEVAKALGLPPESVTAMPTPPPDPLGDANVLVLLGPDAKP